MSEQPPRIERHEAFDRFGKTALRTAHDLTAGLTEAGFADEPIVLRTDGPHRSIDGLAALIDAALADEEPVDGRPRTREGQDVPPS
jgi:hypothetical protein